MLVLTRKAGETIELPDLGITILVARIWGAAGNRQVRIGIEAPREVAVMRGEILPLARLGQAEMAPEPPALPFADDLCEAAG